MGDMLRFEAAGYSKTQKRMKAAEEKLKRKKRREFRKFAKKV